MKRPDDFEIFHQRRKRPPLANIGTNNTLVRQLELNKRVGPVPIIRNYKYGGSKTPVNLGGPYGDKVHDFSGVVEGNKIYSDDKENKDALDLRSTQPRATPLFNSSKLFERACGVYKHKDVDSRKRVLEPRSRTKQFQQAIPITRIGELLSEKKSSLRRALALQSANTQLEDLEPRLTNVHFGLMQSLVDYDSLTESSNKAIRPILVHAKTRRLNEPKNLRARSCLSGDLRVAHSSHHNSNTTVVISRITELSPFLLAVTTSQSTDILLLNTHDTKLSAGSRIELGDHFVYKLCGIPTNAYYKWQILL